MAERRVTCRSWGSLSDSRHVPRRSRLDAVPERRHPAVRRQHLVRFGRRAGRGSAAARHGHRPSVLRQEGADRPVVPGQLPAHSSALGPRAGPAVLHSAAARRLASRRLRPRARRWSIARRGGVDHDPSAAVPRQRRRVARHGQLSRHRRHRVLDRRVQRDGPPDSAPRADVGIPRRAATVARSPTFRITSSRSTAATRLRPARSNWSKVSTC